MTGAIETQTLKQKEESNLLSHFESLPLELTSRKNTELNKQVDLTKKNKQVDCICEFYALMLFVKDDMSLTIR